MDPTLIELRHALAQFLDQEVAPAATSGEARATLPPQWIKRLGELGYLHPGAVMGSGLDLLAEAVVVTEVARVWGALAVSVAASLVTARAMASATEAETLGVSALRRGDATAAIGRLSGGPEGRLALGVPGADVALVLPDPQRADATPAVIVRRPQDSAVEYEGLRGLRGLTASGPSAASFSAEQGTRWLAADRILLAAVAAGLAQGALDRAAAYANDRVQFGRPIGAFGEMQALLVRAASRVVAARHAALFAAELFDGGQCSLALATHGFLSAAEAAVRVCERAQHVHGGYGQMAEYQIGRFVRDARTLSSLVAPHSEMIRFLARDLGLRSDSTASDVARERGRRQQSL